MANDMCALSCNSFMFGDGCQAVGFGLSEKGCCRVGQIHGHDFACMAVLPSASPPCYAVGSEEKVIRVLEAPQAFEQTLALARGHVTATSTPGRQVWYFLHRWFGLRCIPAILHPFLFHQLHPLLHICITGAMLALYN